MPFLGKYGPKNQNCCFKLKLSTLPNLDMQVSMVMFTFSIFDRKYSFWSKKIKTVSLISWYSVPRRIWIFKIPWWCSLFCFRTEIPFLGKFSLENQNCQPKLKFGTSNVQNSMVMFNFAILNWKCPFWASLVQKIKIFRITWNFVLRLIQICRIQEWCSLFCGNLDLKFVQSKIWYLV